jgi:hypothetical protein
MVYSMAQWYISVSYISWYIAWYNGLTKQLEKAHLRRQRSKVQHAAIVFTGLKQLQASLVCLPCGKNVRFSVTGCHYIQYTCTENTTRSRT